MYSKEKAKSSTFYSYTNYINGFAAQLEEEEAAAIAGNLTLVLIDIFANEFKVQLFMKRWRHFSFF